MADFGRTDYWAPDSELNSDPNDPGKDFTLEDGSILNVKINDWLDLDEAIPADPMWGSSFQVIDTQDDFVIIKMYDITMDLYQPVAISPSLILNNYRRVPKV